MAMVERGCLAIGDITGLVASRQTGGGRRLLLQPWGWGRRSHVADHDRVVLLTETYDDVGEIAGYVWDDQPLRSWGVRRHHRLHRRQSLWSAIRQQPHRRPRPPAAIDGG